MNINCVMVADNNKLYIYQALVVMDSVLEHTGKDNEIKFWVICSRVIFLRNK